MPAPPNLRWLLLVALVATGCDGPATVAQRLTGEWVGRPESAAERTVREWPTRKADPDNPEIAEAAAAAPPTDLEAFPDVRVQMRLDASGAAELSLAGGDPLTGQWVVTPIEGRRAVLEIAVVKDPNKGNAEDDNSPEGADPGDALKSRRFDVELLADGKGFVLREQGADRRFGRLIFRHPGDEGPDPTITKSDQSPTPPEAAE